MTGARSALFHSQVFHRRARPRRHKLSYRVFFALLDLDELAELHATSRWFSVNRLNLFSFFDRDHGDGNQESTRRWVERQLAGANLEVAAHRIEILCFPRVLGYVFNPLSVYFCYDASDTLRTVIYEVNNTFGERHSYLAPIDASDAGVLRHRSPKRFYVSPFNDVSGHYDFSVRRPDARLLVHIHQSDHDGGLLDAWVKGRRADWSDAALLTCLTRYPLLTLKVIGGIHFEALKLWLKGLRTAPRPSPPSTPVTLVQD